VPLEPIPEPFGSRWSLSGHIRYIRLGTRTTVTLGSATQFKLLVQEFSGSWRTPQGTIPKAPPDLSDALHLRSEGLIERRLHCGHSTPEPLDVKAARVVSGAEQLVGDVERGHDGDALHVAAAAGALVLAVVRRPDIPPRGDRVVTLWTDDFERFPARQVVEALSKRARIDSYA